MRNARIQAVEGVACRLFRAEAAVSEAVREVAALVAEVENARRTANLALIVGSDAGLHSINSLMALGNAKQELVYAHADFAAAKHDIGLGAVATGVGGGDKPDQTAPIAKLSVAA